MSIHRSLASQGKLIRHRNVLRRAERLQSLLESERWKATDSPFGLPKLRNIKHKAKKAKKTAETAAPGAAPAAPAAGAKPAAGKAAAPAAKPAGDKGAPPAKGAKK